MIVTNSITAAKINSNGLSIKDAYGNIILAAGSALDFSNVGGSTKPANNATVGATFGTNISGQITAATASTYIASLAVDTLQLKDNAITSAWTDNMAVKQALSTAGTWVTKTFTSFTVPVAGKLVVIIHSTYHNFGTASNLRMQCIHFVNGSASTVEYPSFFLNAAAVNASLSPLGGISTAGTSATHTSSEELIVTAGQTITVEITAWAASANSTLYLLDGWFVASLYKK